jgi:hypothetical protein
MGIFGATTAAIATTGKTGCRRSRNRDARENTVLWRGTWGFGTAPTISEWEAGGLVSVTTSGALIRFPS